MSEWATYYKKHTGRQPREQVIRAINLCKLKERALDLGAGTLVESALMLGSGFNQVLAVDNSIETKFFAGALDSKHFSLEIVPFEEFDFSKNYFDLVSSQYALPFYGSVGFKDFIEKIKDSLKFGGVFAGQLFGIRDEWNVEGSNLVFQDTEEARRLLNGFELVEFKETEFDGETADGNQKHWHVFHFIAIK